MIRHFPERMLRLGHGHAIARHDDHGFGILHHEGSIFSRALLNRLRLALACGRPCTLATKATEDDRNEAAVHALAHDVGQDGTG